MTERLRFHELTDVNDDLLIPWLDLYEMAFPPEERVLVSEFLKLLKRKAADRDADAHMVAALDARDEFVGMMRFDINKDTRLAYLWYLAVAANARNRGLGGVIHEHVLNKAREAGAKAALFEVEAPESFEDPHLQETAARRIGFYQRHGALMLTGISYIHRAAPHQPEVPMHIMVSPFEPVTPGEAYNWAKSLFGEDISKTGTPGLK